MNGTAPRHKIDYSVILARVIAGLVLVAGLVQGPHGSELLALLPERYRVAVPTIATLLLALLRPAQAPAGVSRAVAPAPPDVPLTQPLDGPPAQPRAKP